MPIKMSGLTYLITGGAGFIGSHLCDELLLEGHRVIVIDNLSTGSRENIAHHFSNPRFEFYNDSVTNESLMEKLVEQCDRIFHLAAVVGVKSVIDSPIRTIETSARGMSIVLSLADKMHKQVLFTSTSEVYGKSEALPFSEQSDLIFGASNIARWSYACSKAMDEFHALAYHAEHHLQIAIVRLFNTVGPRQSSKYGMVMPRFIEAALSNNAITVYGDGSHKRCFGHVKDVTWALKKIIAEPNCAGQVYNVGSNEEISILNLAYLVKSRLNSTSEIVFVPYEKIYGPNFEETKDRAPNTGKLQSAIGFNPKTTIAAMIDEIAASYRE